MSTQKENKKVDKVFKKTLLVGESKKGNKYLYIETKAGKLVFVNLVQNNKRLNLALEGVKTVDVDYTSYNNDYKKQNMTLFNVSNIILSK